MNQAAADRAFQADGSYRGRIYTGYVSARCKPLEPSSSGDLRSRAPYLQNLIRDHFPADRDAAIVDLGCGYGALLYFAQRAGYTNLEGIDRSSEQIAAAKNLGIGPVSEGDLMEALSMMPDESRDVVVTFDVIEHFRKDELIVLGDEVWRVLRPDGRWIIHVPNAESPFGGRTRYGDFTHEIAFTRDSISQLILSARFTRAEYYEDAPVVHGLKSFIRSLLWMAIRMMLRLWLAVETGETAGNAIFSQNLLAVAVK
jgi:SAM-dependent methyltransferase